MYSKRHTCKNIPVTTLITLGLLLASSPALAGSVYVGYGQSEQISQINNTELDFRPVGTTALLSLDVTDNLSISADIYSADDSQLIRERIGGDLDIDSWSVGVGYYMGNWAFSANYLSWKDELHIRQPDNPMPLLDQQTESPSFSLQASYAWQVEQWQLGAGVGLHYGEWELQEQRNPRNNPASSSLDEGDSTFVSVDVSVSRFVAINQNQALIWGLGLRWNQLTDSESNAVSRNGRNVSQISNRTVRNLINAQTALGSESYGQVNTYISFDLSKNWVLDLSGSFDFGGEEDSSAWALNLGYMF